MQPQDFTPNQKLTVRDDHPYHPGRVGYFHYLGEESQVVVLVAEKNEMCSTCFAVKVSDLKTEEVIDV